MNKLPDEKLAVALAVIGSQGTNLESLENLSIMLKDGDKTLVSALPVLVNKSMIGLKADLTGMKETNFMQLLLLTLTLRKIENELSEKLGLVFEAVPDSLKYAIDAAFEAGDNPMHVMPVQ